MKLSTAFFAFAVAATLAVASVVADSASYQKRTQKKFLDDIAAQPGVTSFQGGKLLVKVTKKGGDGGKSPNVGDPCDVHYAGSLKDGTEFDSSIARGSPATFAPNQVIKSWTQALQFMAEGDEIKIFAHSDIAYGASGSPPRIPPNSPLVFVMKLLKVKSGGKSAAEARKLWQEQSDKKVEWDSVEVVSA